MTTASTQMKSLANQQMWRVLIAIIGAAVLGGFHLWNWAWLLLGAVVGQELVGNLFLVYAMLAVSIVKK